MTQKETIYNILFHHAPLHTEQVEIMGLKEGISGGSAGRYLRWLQEEGKIRSWYDDRRTKVWDIAKKGEQINLFTGYMYNISYST